MRFDDLHRKGENTFRPYSQTSGITAVGQTSRVVENLPRSAVRSRCAASRSWIEAAVTTTASSSPFTSTATCRLTPFVLLPPSQPRLDRGTVSPAGTVCESMIAAVGHRSRPSRTRRRSRSASTMRRHAPRWDQRAKTAYRRPGRRELHRQLPPRDTTAHDVQGGVHYQTAAMFLGSAAAACRAARCGQQRFEGRPLCVGDRRRVHRATMSARRVGRARRAWRNRR